jgi:hypothetical protein
MGRGKIFVGEPAGVGTAKSRRSRDLHTELRRRHQKKCPAKPGNFLVEAAGVEPASENTSSQSTTCVSPFDCRGQLRTEPSAPSASPEKFHHHASRRTVVTSLLNDGYSKATGLLRVTAHWFLSSESVVCVRSYVVFPQDLRGRGPRHAFRDPAPPSKPSRPRGVGTANYCSSLLEPDC